MANRPERLAVEEWIARHPTSFLGKKVSLRRLATPRPPARTDLRDARLACRQQLAAAPHLRLEWREQISAHIAWMRAQGVAPAEASRSVQEAARRAAEKQEEERARQRAHVG